MSGYGFPKDHGLYWSLGKLVSFSWMPSGILAGSNPIGGSPLTFRNQFLMNKFANNNYPDRDGIADELKNDSRFEEKNRIKVKDNRVTVWPPYERPAIPLNGVDPDQKDHEGKFGGGTKITKRLKIKKPPKDVFDQPNIEPVYPTEAKSSFKLHSSEHIDFLPKEGDTYKTLDKKVAHWIFEYTNELRQVAKFKRPLRGEYSPAKFILEFNIKKGLPPEHESGSFPEGYKYLKDRVERTRQFPATYYWWYAENLQYDDTIAKKALKDNNGNEDAAAKQIARAVVDGWIGSPGHHANMINYDDADHVNFAVLDVKKIGDYYSQVMMGCDTWLRAGNSYWRGDSEWKVLSWGLDQKYDKYNARHVGFEYNYLYWKGKIIAEVSQIIGASIYKTVENQYKLLIARFFTDSKEDYTIIYDEFGLPTSYDLIVSHIQIYSCDFPFYKKLSLSDFTLLKEFDSSLEFGEDVQLNLLANGINLGLLPNQRFLFSENGKSGSIVLMQMFDYPWISVDTGNNEDKRFVYCVDYSLDFNSFSVGENTWSYTDNSGSGSPIEQASTLIDPWIVSPYPLTGTRTSWSVPDTYFEPLLSIKINGCSGSYEWSYAYRYLTYVDYSGNSKRQVYKTKERRFHYKSSITMGEVARFVSFRILSPASVSYSGPFLYPASLSNYAHTKDTITFNDGTTEIFREETQQGSSWSFSGQHTMIVVPAQPDKNIGEYYKVAYTFTYEGESANNEITYGFDQNKSIRFGARYEPGIVQLHNYKKVYLIGSSIFNEDGPSYSDGNPNHNVTVFGSTPYFYPLDLQSRSYGCYLLTSDLVLNDTFKFCYQGSNMQSLTTHHASINSGLKIFFIEYENGWIIAIDTGTTYHDQVRYVYKASDAQIDTLLQTLVQKEIQYVRLV